MAVLEVVPAHEALNPDPRLLNRREAPGRPTGHPKFDSYSGKRLISFGPGGPKCNYTGSSGGFGQGQGIEKVQLFRGWAGRAFEGALADPCSVPLDACEQVERGAGASAVAPGLQVQAHDAVEHEGEEADQRMGADAVWEAVVDGRDIDVGFQHAEAAFDVGEALVARDSVGGGQVGGVGDQREPAIEELCLGDGSLVQAVAEARQGTRYCRSSGSAR